MTKIQWPVLKECVEKGVIEPIDLFSAERVLINAGDVGEEVVALLALMMWSYRRGNLCFDGEEGPLKLRELAQRGINAIPEFIHQVLEGDEPMPLKPICSHEGRFYFQKNWVYETRFLNEFLRLVGAQPAVAIEQLPLPEKLNQEQREAMRLGLQSSVFLLVGGPGTGKTFTAGHLVKQSLMGLPAEERKRFQIVLTAPTGKAVTHLEKQIGGMLEHGDRASLQSGTLHALLELREDGTQRKKVVLFADLVIVDESSMIDAKMHALLLEAIPSGARVIFIGDQDQLPPVEAGCFFADLIESGCPMVTLKESRRVRNDTLASLADAIKRGDGEEFGPFLQEKEGMLSMLCDWVDEYYPSFYSTLPDARALLQGFEKFRILSCLRQGPWGVDEINRTLLDRFQANCPREGWWVIPILVTRNDDATQLYNGDMGVLIKKIDPFNREMKWGREDYALFSGRDPLPVFGLPPFEYAYCLTIHKSQGSEYENVVVLVPEGSDRFGKEILYTAVTRAKSDLKVFAQEGMIEKMIAKASKKKSGLTARLQQRCKVSAN